MLVFFTKPRTLLDRMTEALLQSRSIFIDTQCYVALGLRFNHPTLAHLKRLCAAMSLQLVVTETVVGEVKGKIAEKLVAASNNLREFHKTVSILEAFLPGKFSGVFPEMKQQDIVLAGHDAWAEFLKEANAVIIPATVIDSSRLLTMYFNSEAPFGSGKKKSEFPDAISTLSIEHWTAQNAQKIYIVSGDADLAQWCERRQFAIHVETLGEFLDLYNRAAEKLTTLAHKLLEEEEGQLLSLIENAALNCGFVYENNTEADVYDVAVRSINLFDTNLIEIDEERALFALRVQIRFDAAVQGPDYEHAIWDSEDGRYMYLPEFNISDVFEETLSVSVEMCFSLEEEKVTGFGDIHFDDGADITLSKDDGYPYK